MGNLNFVDNDAVYGGVAPLVVALIVAVVLVRSRFTWLAIAAAYAVMVALSTGYSFSPLTVARKIALVGLLAPLVGVAADFLPARSRVVAPALVVAMGLLSIWVFTTVLQQRDETTRIAIGAGIALFVAAFVAVVLRLRKDGLRGGAAGLGLGLAAGIAGVLSASIGALIAGVSIAAACGAMLLVQVVLSRKLAPGFTGALPVGLLCALIAAGTLLLAELPWYALPLLLLVPAATLLPVPERGPMFARAAVLSGYTLVAAVIPIGAAWYAAHGSIF